MGLTFLTGYILGQHGAQSARLASTAASGSGSSVKELLDVHDRVDRLILVVDAMWSLLEDSGYTDEQLRARIEQIDSADGVLDGKRTPQIAQCSGCGAKVAAGLATCQFCGASVPGHVPDPLGDV
ncbi:MAG: hypothetical protein ACR2N7_03635 [Acidimicrobiia bacterium]